LNESFEGRTLRIIEGAAPLYGGHLYSAFPFPFLVRNLDSVRNHIMSYDEIFGLNESFWRFSFSILVFEINRNGAPVLRLYGGSVLSVSISHSCSKIM
ncbi:hypothetical protein L9F63_020986, partial [Diploptera punctata]